jgi:hypothetical protein
MTRYESGVFDMLGIGFIWENHPHKEWSEAGYQCGAVCAQR